MQNLLTDCVKAFKDVCRVINRERVVIMHVTLALTAVMTVITVISALISIIVGGAVYLLQALFS